MKPTGFFHVAQYQKFYLYDCNWKLLVKTLNSRMLQKIRNLQEFAGQFVAREKPVLKTIRPVFSGIVIKSHFSNCFNFNNCWLNILQLHNCTDRCSFYYRQTHKAFLETQSFKLFLTYKTSYKRTFTWTSFCNVNYTTYNPEYCVH